MHRGEHPLQPPRCRADGVSEGALYLHNAGAPTRRRASSPLMWAFAEWTGVSLPMCAETWCQSDWYRPLIVRPAFTSCNFFNTRVLSVTIQTGSQGLLLQRTLRNLTRKLQRSPLVSGSPRPAPHELTVCEEADVEGPSASDPQTSASSQESAPRQCFVMCGRALRATLAPGLGRPRTTPYPPTRHRKVQGSSRSPLRTTGS